MSVARQTGERTIIETAVALCPYYEINEGQEAAFKAIWEAVISQLLRNQLFCVSRSSSTRDCRR